MIENEPLFASAHAALAFAFNFSGEQYPPSIMSRLMTGIRLGSGKGLVGLDGAGQAGMILNEVNELGETAKHFLAARFAPHYKDCDCRKECCTGFKPGRSFKEGIDWITERSLDHFEGRVNLRLRRGIVLRFFGERESFTELAKHARVNRDTASQHNARLLPWLKHEDGAAIHAAVVRLKERGVVA